MNESLCVTVILEYKDEYKPIKIISAAGPYVKHTTDSNLPEKPVFCLLNFGVLEKDLEKEPPFVVLPQEDKKRLCLQGVVTL